MADVEERLLEKELLHDLVRQITDRLEGKVRTLKPSSLSVTEKVSWSDTVDNSELNFLKITDN